MSKPLIHVAIALLFHQSKVLVGWRNATQHQGNKYEFPGGKVDQGETPEQACRREIFEEVGVGIQDWNIFDVVRHEYDDIEVHLHIFHAQVPTKYVKDIQQPWNWYSREKLLELNFPKANQGIIQRLYWAHFIKISEQLSELDRLQADSLLYWRADHEQGNMFLADLENIQLNRLILNVDIWKTLDISLQKKVAAVHYKQSQLFALQKGDLPVAIRTIAACHDAVSLQRAEQLGFDAVLLSPVQNTETHQGVEPLGWDQFNDLAKQCSLPVFALGGLKPDDLGIAQQHHAYGVAGIRNF
ncbi:NUDIX domain-containing protein [Acinetobacter stercoris]|uniref:8-oxo-dGTP diphosphatase n=1 Tax=Acinetobacter stercoris TaxID=2126983 RepID=A0A2U3MYT8_9GAMM|nr:NUDIX domain-containing protein [Acinetobacter stercoris]SPL70590.1 8-oxo-dGTP diphosphatase [Acinetobacter stercoris]